MKEKTVSYPRLSISLSKIEQNARAIETLCRSQDIEIFGVTKGVYGSLEVASAMLKGGVFGLADSHLKFLKQFRAMGLNVPLCLLRQPMRFEMAEAAKVADYCMISEFSAAEMLSREARKVARTLKIILFVETGSMREGMTTDEIAFQSIEITKLPHLELAGLAVYRTCCNGQGENPELVLRLVEIYESLKQKLGREMEIISGGNSSGLGLVASGRMPPLINNLRIGEAILLGHETADYKLLPKASPDAFILTAEIIEVKRKPTPASPRRVIVALGREDLAQEPVRPLLRGKEVMRGSSHLVIELADEERDVQVGATISFIPSYFALVAAMASPFVKKIYVD